MKMLVFFLAKCVWTAVKTMVVDRKKPKSTSSAIFGVETAAKSCELKRCANRVRNRTDKANLNFSPAWTLLPNFFLPKLNFSLSTKKTTEYSFDIFCSINKFVFDFCCLCLFCYNAGQDAISPQKHGIQHRVISSVCHFILVTGRTDVRTYGHVTVTSLQKLLGLIGYQISLAMVLRWRACARAPLRSHCYKHRCAYFARKFRKVSDESSKMPPGSSRLFLTKWFLKLSKPS